MTAKNQNAEVYQGADKVLRFRVPGKDFTGGQFRYIASYFNALGAALITKTEGGAVVRIAAGAVMGNEVIEVPLVPADTATLAGVFHHELRAWDAGGVEDVVADGGLTVTESSTKT